ncbi:hypothetical protein G3N55_03700 [Dissulfurirhabdus thermomarina]|uniref:Desulfoferrodoxin n=1 Tax=Dissulfurirhabdus thermomarina TaxID=1765737 RepID=A0A6N9TPD0_DISTH|nr:hypothetical protein [Dissulfurirhabdus thermomarina]NDY41953.1 hypothetical protein [Dissulfurirhabdus thermomarina]NMX22937.1 hypothetical protein [Dissulfurirhabdus thermomarina]
MRIDVDRNVVEMRPETEAETAALEVLWRVIVGCAQEGKKLVPIGEYVPVKERLARFLIEGVPGGKTAFSDRKARAGTYVCTVCNKYMDVAEGASVPLCCGREMEHME